MFSYLLGRRRALRALLRGVSLLRTAIVGAARRAHGPLLLLLLRRRRTVAALPTTRGPAARGWRLGRRRRDHANPALGGSKINEQKG